MKKPPDNGKSLGHSSLFAESQPFGSFCGPRGLSASILRVFEFEMFRMSLKPPLV